MSVGDKVDPVDWKALLRQALAAVDEMRAKLDRAERAGREPIAIIGASCRYPGAPDGLDGLWRVLADGQDAVSEVPADRWDVDAYYSPDPNAPGKMITRRGGFLKSVDQFDPQFFNISPREAVTMDPQQRLLLEVTWEALEHAGQATDALLGSQTGVFVGITTSDYAHLVGVGTAEQSDVYAATGNALNAAAGRLSFILGLQGPCVAVDTACSSSLVAIHLACQSLRTGESQLAIAGGVNVVLRPEAALLFSKWGMLAPDGRCKTFDAAADGFVRGEGCGVIVLKKLSDAIANGDHVLAVIRGSATNQDGKSSGLTVPNGPAQQAVIRKALASAGIEAASVQYVEAHGTGTPIGDPIEVEALAAEYGKGRAMSDPLLIGSIKTNIGHAEAASGIAGVLKVVLSLQHGLLPAHLHINTPNPRIAWDRYPLAIPSTARPWTGDKGPRRAGVSSFGFSGTNAHVILEEAPASLPTAPAAPSGMARIAVPLSARTPEALSAAASRLAAHLDAHAEVPLEAAAFTAGTGRTHFANRLVVHGTTRAEIVAALKKFAGEDPAGEITGRAVTGEVRPGATPKVAFLFTGQGSQYTGMARELYRTNTVVKTALDECAAILQPMTDRPLLDVIFLDESGAIDQTAWTQPALFSVEYALAMLWRSWGVEPAAVLGHSLGEYVAATIAGVLNLKDALTLVAARGRLMQALPAGGAMAAVFAPEERVQPLIAPVSAKVSIAALNAPGEVVISGDGEAVAAVCQACEAASIRTKALTVSHAFHSPLMEPMLDEFEKIAGGLTFAAPRIPLISNTTGAFVTAKDPMDAGYWRRHIRQAVRFVDSIKAVHARGIEIFLEIGPAPVLSAMATQILAPARVRANASLRKGRDEWSTILDALAGLHVDGVPVNWAGVHATHRRVPLPSYPFQRKRYWLDTRGQGKGRQAAAPMPGTPVRSAGTGEIVCQTELSAADQPFLADHAVFGSVIFPAAGYITLALGASARLDGDVRDITGFSLHQPLLFGEHEQRTIQTILSPAEAGTWQFAVHSRPAGDESAPWVRHVTGALTASTAQVTSGRSLDAARAECAAALASSDFYDRLGRSGIEYGPSYRCLSEVHVGEAQAIGHVTGVDTDSEHVVHPAMLDAAFQVLGAAWTTLLPDGSESMFLPIGFSRLRTSATFATGKSLWAAARVGQGSVNPAELETIAGDLVCYDEHGLEVLAIEGFTAKRATKEALHRALRKDVGDLLYEVAWRQSPAPATLEDSGAPRGDHWVVLADRAGLGSALADEVRGRGVACSLLFRASDGSSGFPAVPSVSREDIARALDEAARAHGGRLDGIVYLWALDDSEGSAETATRVADEALAVTQASVGRDAIPRLTFVTRNGQRVGHADSGEGVRPTVVNVAHATLWGLARTVAAERPESACRVVDLTDSTDVKADAAAVAGELADTMSTEPQVAYRAGARLVPRLVRSKAARETDGLIVPDMPSALTIRTRGVLEDLELTPLPEREPGPGEVKIRVTASGLNFRDVLNALGMYPGDAGALGCEVAGEVVAVGTDVNGLSIGDRVMSIADRAFSTYAYAREAMARRVPQGLTDEEAVTIPNAYLTAHYALSRIAHLKAGERVLIHAAAGGVGLAAVHLALRAGAEVFATAGSPAKRDFLRSLGVRHLMDSRTLEFADVIRTITEGTGIDVVLNALTGESIEKSLSVLRAGGRFVEIGKTDLWTPERVAAVNAHVTYTVLDLGAECQSRLATVGAVFEDLALAVSEGSLPPLPRHLFSLTDVREAFRFMAQARHTGKVVVVHPPARQLRERATYLVTGGASGLGLAAARWMAAQGARDIVLVSRSAPSEDAAREIEAMNASGARVVHAAADVAGRAALAAVLSGIPRDRPLRGIVHAAGVVDDGAIGALDRTRLAAVLAPKVTGATHLDELTAETPLDFFVLFSAGAGLFGSAGQANYAAANAALDALAHRRRAQGRPCMTINWGPWAEIGMAARLGARERDRWAASGVGTIDPARGLDALQECLRRDRPQIAVLPINWRQFARQLNGQPAPSFVSELVETGSAGVSGAQTPPSADWLKRLEDADPLDRADLMHDYLRDQIGRVLGLDASVQVGPDDGLSALGMDSLMAVELSNRLKASLRQTLSATVVFEYPTINLLTAYLFEQVLKLPMAAPAPAPQDSLDHLSREELERELDTELGIAGY